MRYELARSSTASAPLPSEWWAVPRFSYMLIDADGQRVGRFETSRLEWRPGETVDAEGTSWRIVEMLPEVSTAVEYVGVWVVEPA